jgi:hypothetical protein
MTQLVKYVISSAGQRQCQELGEEGLANVSGVNLPTCKISLLTCKRQNQFLFQDLRRNINLEALGLRK